MQAHHGEWEEFPRGDAEALRRAGIGRRGSQTKITKIAKKPGRFLTPRHEDTKKAFSEEDFFIS